ncbi:MAG: hypothetical protein E7310_06500 [Clostridiales bacterium]|nr:hypothetical protein [Clostridiales bacterium]
MIDINGKFIMKLSLDSISEYIDYLTKYGTQRLPEIAENIVTRVSEEGLKDNYKSTVVIPTKNSGGIITGGIETKAEKDTYLEFGTGFVGSENPHVDTMLSQAGWKYDVNKHGKKGWLYPKGDGTFGWTKGHIAEKKFYNAMNRMQDSFQEIAREEFKRGGK